MSRPQNSTMSEVALNDKNYKPVFYDTIEDWHKKISALCNTVGSLAAHEGHEEIMRLAEIIGDYSNAINIEMAKRQDVLERIDDAIFSPLSRAEEVMNFLNSNPINSSSDLDPVLYQIQVLDKFIKAHANPAIEIKNRFEDIAVKYHNKAKRK